MSIQQKDLNQLERDKKEKLDLEKQIKSFLNKGIKCSIFKATISKEQCERNQSMSTMKIRHNTTEKGRDTTVSGCKNCKHYNVDIANRPKSIGINGERFLNKVIKSVPRET